MFHGDLDGLCVVEVELDDVDAVVTPPVWVGEEVTFDVHYKNAMLAVNGGAGL
ncbi:hypothetical protein OIU34_21695 [Pararhizobium sp. BT-229]|uniref:hypothetical protein n=1 Tax=Pararhizobium sp. BT-229 TaxID=2986923 RepID=UPI0021F715F9|nr:hypothetical protein [Pararhizobium sp. BT-229]MCV9964507.1 hypothetical protein [Pararhizobium sp. BT-229]